MKGRTVYTSLKLKIGRNWAKGVLRKDLDVVSVYGHCLSCNRASICNNKGNKNNEL